jgi:hypothetical protein
MLEAGIVLRLQRGRDAQQRDENGSGFHAA